MGLLGNLFGRALGAVTGNFRLVIEYILIGLIVAMAGVLFTLWLQKGTIELNLEKTKNSLSTVQERLDVVEDANSKNNQTIEQLKQLRIRDNKALQELVQNFQELSDINLAVKNKLRELEATNEVVRKYLNAPIPDSLRGLLNGTSTAHSPGDKPVGTETAPKPSR